MVIHLPVFCCWTLSFLLERNDRYVFKRCGCLYIPSSLIHRFLRIAVLLPRHCYPQSTVFRPPSAEERAPLRWHSHSPHIAARLCTPLHRSDLISPVLPLSSIKIPENRDSLYHNCSRIAALSHPLKQLASLFRLQSYPCQADAANQSPAQR